jgi:hypothetical protein
MEALFQIGKELGALTARVLALESQKCGCGGSKRGELPTEAMTNEQREVLQQLRKSHKDIFARINEVLREYNLGDKIKARGLRLVNVNVPITPHSDLCCYCCLDGHYCCNFDCDPCCDDKW